MSDTVDLQYVNGPQGDNDPLKAKANGETARKELFQRLAKTASGFTHRDAVYACMNLILNAIRQNCATALEAEQMFDEMVYHGKATLLGEHYTHTGSRRNVFPFDQHIVMPLMTRKPQ